MMRRAVVAAGLILLAVTWLGPLPALAGTSFTAHMTMHVLVVAVAAPLIAIGISGTPLDPVQRVPAIFPVVPAAVIELIVVWAWHAPALHHAARHVPLALALEQSSYLAVGLLVWFAAFGGARRRRRERAAAGIVGLLLTSMHMTLLGVLLALASRPLYEHAGGALFGLTPMQDQHLGGVVMLVFGGSTYLVGGLFLLADLLRRERDVVSAG